VEDAFITADPLISNLNFQAMGVTLRPMAWSDDIVAFAASTVKVARILSHVAEVLRQRHLHNKEDSAEIVQLASDDWSVQTFALITLLLQCATR